MRLDKYLKLTRLIKRREVAKVLIEEGSVLINDKKVKPSFEIKIGDIVSLKLGQKIIKVRVTDIFENANKIDANKLYVLINQSIIKNN